MPIAPGYRDGWLTVSRRYVIAMALGNLAWEFVHMPLYTLWDSGSLHEIAFAAIHCTGGDMVIAVAALMGALLLFGSDDWPVQGYRRVAVRAIAIGLGYTLFSEWLNIEVRKAWAYSDLMPIIPVIGAGISPVSQWVVVPSLAFWWAIHVKEDRG